MKWKKHKPHLKPYIGCLNCGGGEMRYNKDKNEIIASMKTRIYNGFGGWHIECNGEIIYMPPLNKEWKDFPTLMKFENMARKNPDNDWRAVAYLAMRGVTYQRQGTNRWVLIKSNQGFA